MENKKKEKIEFTEIGKGLIEIKVGKNGGEQTLNAAVFTEKQIAELKDEKEKSKKTQKDT